MSSNTTNKRVFGWDLLKALAMFLVVFYHFGMLDFSYNADEFYFPNLNKIIQSLCVPGVPLFFMVNGALTINSKTSFKKVVNKVVRLIAVAVFWTLLLRCGVMGLLLEQGQPSVMQFKDFYWFLYSLAILYFINYLIQILPKWIGYLFVVAIFIVTFLNNFVWDVILFAKPSTTLPSWGLTGLFTLYGVVYSRIGAYLKDVKLNPVICIILFVVGVGLNLFKITIMTNHTGLLLDGVNSSFPTIGAMFASIALFGLLKGVKEPFFCSQLIKTIGVNSIGVYIFHLVIIVVLRGNLLGGVFHIQYLPLAVVLCIALCITILCAYISEGLQRTPAKVLLKL